MISSFQHAEGLRASAPHERAPSALASPAAAATKARATRPWDGAAEVAVLREAAAGASAAFEELVYRYERRVFVHVWQLVRDHEEAEDLAQETFVRVFQSLSTFDPRFAFRTWLFRIASNLALSSLRRRGRVVSLETHPEGLDALATDAGHAPDARLHADADRVRATAALAALPATARAIVQLRYAEEMSMQEISETLEMKPGTVAVTLHRARAAMRDALRREEAQPS